MLPCSPGLIPAPPVLQAALRTLFKEWGDESSYALGDLLHRTVLDHLDACRWSAAGEQLRDSLDRDAWPRGLPWKRPVKPGQLDFWRIHAFALDRLDELLALLLPDGAEGFTDLGTLAWIGRHPDRPETVAVCLLRGAWDEPGTGHGGRDLISLVAHLTGLGQGQAARWLANWAGIGGRRHA